MGIESKIHRLLSGMPVIKKGIKRVYQLANVAVFRPKKSEGNITQVTPNDGYEYFFGYYDKSPWDISNRYMLCLRAKNTTKSVAPEEPADIVLIDTQNNNSIKKIATTHSWNVQQGCMAGWLGPNFKDKIFYNDFRNGKHRGIILDINTGEETIYDMPFYTVSNDGKIALTLDFTRLHRLRPGYGYSNLEDKTKGEKVPDAPCIWKINLGSKKITPVLKYKDLYNFEHRPEMEGAEHKVNHLMLCPNGKRFMAIHRWLKGGKKYSRLITCDVDGENLYNLSDDNMVSHCYWKNETEILAFCRKNKIDGYYLMKDKTQDYKRKWDFLSSDGHPSYSPDKKHVVTDTYPNRNRISTIRILTGDVSVPVAKVYSPFKYDNDTRCDFHPRWSRDGNMICFDGCANNKRALYIVNLPENILQIENPQSDKKGDRLKIAYIMTSCRKSGPTQQTLSMVRNINKTKFDPILITIYEEENNTQIGDFLQEVSQHIFIKTGKKAILRNKTISFKEKLDEINPEVIHTVGVFPNYLISKLGYKNHIFTLHNFAQIDYVAKYGKIKGRLLTKMQLDAINKTPTVVSCSKSLQKMYKEVLGINTECIQNGVNTEKYNISNNKYELREKLGIDEGKIIFIYSGQFIKRKNVPFLIDGYLGSKISNSKLILLGDGPELEKIRDKYNKITNLEFRGSVNNIDEYLKASDIYISASKLEGLPYGVLEAMSCGLPVLLSNIDQHRELIPEKKQNGGILFDLRNKNSLIEKIVQISKENLKELGKKSRETINKEFNDKTMAKKYETLYDAIKKTNIGGSIMRISILIGSLTGGGAERVACNLANYLSEKGHKIDVITISKKKDTYITNSNINRIILNKNDCGKIKKIREIYSNFKKYINNNKDVDCYIGMLPITIALLINQRKNTKAKIIISERNNPSSYKLYEKIIMKHPSNKCDAMVVQTKDIRKWYKHIHNVYIIPNAINKSYIIPERKLIKNKLVAVGRLEEQKNYQMMIDVFNNFSKNHPEYILEIYGEGSKREKIQKQIAKLNLSNKVYLKGYTKDISEKIKDAKVYILTSNFEGIPNSLIEAMCIGIPSIATECDGGGTKELIKNKINGILVPKNNAKAFKYELENLIEDEKLYNNISKESKKLKRTLSYDKTYEMWNQVILETTKRKAI